MIAYLSSSGVALGKGQDAHSPPWAWGQGDWAEYCEALRPQVAAWELLAPLHRELGAGWARGATGLQAAAGHVPVWGLGPSYPRS